VTPTLEHLANFEAEAEDKAFRSRCEENSIKLIE